MINKLIEEKTINLMRGRRNESKWNLLFDEFLLHYFINYCLTISISVVNFYKEKNQGCLVKYTSS